MFVFHWLLYNPLWWPESHVGYALGSSWVGVNAGLFTIWYTIWRRHNCHVPRCPRVGRHVRVSDEGDHDLYCRKHKPARRSSGTEHASPTTD